MRTGCEKSSGVTAIWLYQLPIIPDSSGRRAASKELVKKSPVSIRKSILARILHDTILVVNSMRISRLGLSSGDVNSHQLGPVERDNPRACWK
jgi:hypothetical protein